MPSPAGDTAIYVRSTTGMSAGDTIDIDGEARKIVSIGTAAAPIRRCGNPPRRSGYHDPCRLDQCAGDQHGRLCGGREDRHRPWRDLSRLLHRDTERYEVASVTAVGKPGTQAFLGADAAAGATNIKVTSVANISAGDKIRLDVETVGHGIETVTVARVGTQSSRSALSADASAGATNIRVRGVNGLSVGDKLRIGTPANKETVTVTGINTGAIDFTPVLAHSHPIGEPVVDPGTGLDLGGPLRFNHTANLPFSAKGTGITFAPATAFAHSSNEPVQPLGAGITLDRALVRAHAIDAVVRDATVTAAGYQGTPAPNQWFGGPALSPLSASMVLRDAAGLVVDSLNYGLLTDPWAAEGYQGTSGAGQGGCRVTSPATPAAAIDRSAR